MNLITQHLNKNNLHHAYLIEGERDEIIPEIIRFCEEIEVKTEGNPDFCHISIDSFKIDEAFELRAMTANKSFSLGHSQTGEASGKRIFLISVNNFTLDAQNVLLKMFEEPVDNTHFFLVVRDADALLKTFISRFYFIPFSNRKKNTNEIEIFIKKDKRGRIDFIKGLLAKEEDGDAGEGNEEGTRSKAIKFIDALESVLHHNMSRTVLDTRVFEHLFKVREFLRMPGSSAKNLLESVALILPVEKS